MKQQLSGLMAAFVLSIAAANDAYASTADEIAAVNQDFETAFASGDATGLAAVYTIDGQLLPTSSPIISGDENIKAFWQGAIDLGIKSAELETIELDVLGDMAVEVGLYKLKGEDSALIDEGKYVVIWKKEGDDWKYHRDIWNSSLPAN